MTMVCASKTNDKALAKACKHMRPLYTKEKTRTPSTTPETETSVVSKDFVLAFFFSLATNVYLCSEAERANPTLPEGSRHILVPLNPRLVLILAVVPAAPRLLEPVQPLLLHCTPPDLHQKPATHTRS